MKIEELVKAIPGDRCVLCGKPPVLIGIFKPDKPESFGAPPGKIRLIRYCLCENCQRKPDTSAKVEKVLMSELLGGVVHAY